MGPDLRKRSLLPAVVAAALFLGCRAPEAEENGGTTEASRSGLAEREVILVIGSIDGMGRALALELGSMGAHVIICGRNGERGQEVVRRIEEEGTGSARFIRADLAEELEGTGVTVNALHPASMMPTTMVLERGGEPRSEIQEGVEAQLNLVKAPDLGSGRYSSGTHAGRARDQAYDEEARRKLRELSWELTGA